MRHISEIIETKVMPELQQRVAPLPHGVMEVEPEDMPADPFADMSTDEIIASFNLSPSSIVNANTTPRLGISKRASSPDRAFDDQL